VYNKAMDCYFFGTFNPIHLGHIEIARRTKALKKYDRIIFVPCYIPPHKHDELISFSHRYEMACLALGSENVSDIESKMNIPSYTYRTVQKLYEENNNQKINFIIGYDQFFKLESWKEPEKLKQTIKFNVIPRRFPNGQIIGENTFEYFRKKGFEYEILDIGLLDISSQMIRKAISEGQDITGLTTSEVKEYIENNGLYTKLAKGKSFR